MILLPVLLLGGAALKTYTLAGFRVGLPGEPVPYGGPGRPAGLRSWVVRSAGGTWFLVTAFEDPKDKTPGDQAMAQFIGGFLNSGRGTLTEQKDLMLDGWPGLETSLRMKDGPAWSRAYGFTGAMFAVVGGGTKDSKPLVDEVFASIALDPNRGRGSQKEPGPAWAPSAIGPYFSVEFPAKVESKDVGVGGVSLIAWRATYGNRTYVACVSAPGTLPSTPEGLMGLAKTANDQAAAGAHATVVRRTASTVLGQPTETVEATAMEGKVAMRIQTTPTADGIVVLSAVVPICWKDNPEVARFLASVRQTGGRATDTR